MIGARSTSRTRRRTASDRPLHVVFVSQGRALAGSAMGHARVKDAVDGHLPDPGSVAVAHLEVPPFGRWPKRALRFVRPLGRWNFWTMRFLLVRGVVTRRVLGDYLGRHEADVLHLTTDQIAFFLGRIRRSVPCVPSLDVLFSDWNRMTHGVAMDSPLPAHLRLIGRWERRALERSALCIAWTECVAARVRELAPRARVLTLHPGLDLADFPTPAPRRPAGQRRVLFVGGRWSEKGGPSLVTALEPWLGADVRLDVVTREPVAAHDGVTVHRLDPGEELQRLFATCDVLCLPSAVDAAPWVVLEAMASGLAVVASDVGSISELLGVATAEPAGRTVPVGDLDALRRTLRDVLDDEGLRERMGRAGRSRVESEYDAARNTPRLIEALVDVARG